MLYYKINKVHGALTAVFSKETPAALPPATSPRKHRQFATPTKSSTKKSGSFNAAALLAIQRWSRSGLREQLVHVVPVHQMIDKRLQVVRAAIAIIDVIGMLPDVDAEDGRCAVDQRVLAIRSL